MKFTQRTNLLEKIKESLSSVLPITLIVLFLSLTICPLPNDIFISFFVGACLMIIGMGLFSLGAETSMAYMGNYVGTKMTKSRKIPIIAIIAFIVGLLITISEPDLHVLAAYAPIDTTLFIGVVSIGLGIFLVVAVLRIIFGVKMKYILLVGYGAVLILSFFVSPGFLPVAFDAGGVTTGAISVPFIMAIGSGIAAIAAEKSGDDNSFGIMAICSIGPILAVLIMSMILGIDGAQYESVNVFQGFQNSIDMGKTYLGAIPHHLISVGGGLLPVVIFFIIYQFISGRISGHDGLRVLIGIIYTYVGIVLFLTGVGTGFMPVGSYVGSAIASSSMPWIIVPIGLILGYFITAAEPAVHVLEKQVEDATSGMIPSKIISRTMAIGVAVSAAIAMLRALTGIPLMPFLMAGYIFAVVLSFLVPPTFTAIAFDGGGVASGAMTATFLFPLAVGVCEASGNNVTTDAFGVIALVAMMPAISIQTVGLIYKLKLRHSESTLRAEGEAEVDILELDEKNEPLSSNEREILNTVSEEASVDEPFEIIEFDLVGKI